MILLSSNALARPVDGAGDGMFLASLSVHLYMCAFASLTGFALTSGFTVTLMPSTNFRLPAFVVQFD